MLSVDLLAFGNSAGWGRLPPEVAALDIQATARDPRFPGAVLPAVSEEGRIFWYAATPDAATWRRLRPLLLAYAGPTVTAFSGVPKPINTSREPERLLAEAQVFAIAVLVPPADGVTLASRSLRRLVDALARAPTEPLLPPVATSVLVARMDMCLAAGDRSGAESCLSQLQAEWRLDVLNLRFTEVRLLAAFRDWGELGARLWFDDLCRVPKPAPVAQALLETLWHTHLEPVADDADELRRRYFAELRPLCLDLLAEVPPGQDGVLHAFRALEVACSGAAPPPASMPAAKKAGGWVDWVMAVTAGERGDAAAAARDAAISRPASAIHDATEAKEIADRLQTLAEGDGRGR
jgi:hypothetical protein